jgi:deoxyribose-phosphate aldolase
MENMTSVNIRNEGVAFDSIDFVNVKINSSAIRKKAGSFKCPAVKEAAWLLRAISCCDITALNGDDTECNIRRLCFKVCQIIYVLLYQGETSSS